MAIIAHVFSVMIIIIVTYVFYFNYDIYHNGSFKILAKNMINNYNYGCDRYGKQPFYIAVKSENIIDNKTVIGDLIEGFVGSVPVLTGQSIVGISDTKYMQFTGVFPIEDQNGLLVENCKHVVDKDYAIYQFVAVLLSIIVLLLCLIVYGLFNRVWLCFSFCRSTQNYDELN